jgi:hypothetical protein
MLEIFDDGHGARSAILTRQLPVEKWRVASLAYTTPDLCAHHGPIEAIAMGGIRSQARQPVPDG